MKFEDGSSIDLRSKASTTFGALCHFLQKFYDGLKFEGWNIKFIIPTQTFCICSTSRSYMSGVIYFKTKYGATEQYANWLSQALGFEAKNIKKGPKLGSENIVIIGSSIIMGKWKAGGWIQKHWPKIKNKKVIILAVGGAKVGSKDRDEAIARSLPSDILNSVKIFHLRGRFDHSKVNFLMSKMIKKGMESEKDPVVKKEWTEGFDDVKLEYLNPIIAYIKGL